MKKILVTQPSMPTLEEYIEEIKDIWDTKWLTNMGDKHQKFEKALEQFLDNNNITLFSNGHLALESAIEVLDLKGEVITTPYTFVSTVHAIVRKGLTPVFCDINPQNFTIDVEQIESLITETTSAIIPVHVYGQICDIEKLHQIAQKYKLKVIYDAAHAFGEKYKGQSIASFGDITMFSFHATKAFHSIEGGALSYQNQGLKTKLNLLKNFGISGPESIEMIGTNAKMNEFQAAMGICNLRHFEEQLNIRKQLFDLYCDLLSSVKGVRMVLPSHDIKSNYSYCPVIFESPYNRDIIFEKLKNNNIYARKYFYPAINELQCYSQFINIATPVSSEISKKILTLPLYSALNKEDIKRICKLILK